MAMLPSLSGLTLREEEVVPTGVDTPIAKKEKKKKPLKSSGAQFSLPKSEDAPCGGLECAYLKLVVKPVREAVNKLFANTNPDVLGSGVDNLAYTKYNAVVPVGVWQIIYGKDHKQRNAYIARKAAMLLENKECNEYGPSHECVRTDKVLATVGDKLVGEAIHPRLAERINEKYLVHGTNAGVLSSIIQSRFKPELSQPGRQAYGAGVYQAEDVGKADQYAKRVDAGADTLDQTLNIRTLATEVDPSLADLPTFYILVTRTLLGCANHVAHAEGGKSMEIIRDMTDKHAFERNPSLDARGLVSYSFRPPYDSIIKEHRDVIRGGFATGPKYREFLVQKADQVLPVMVVAYKRVMVTPEPPFDYQVLQCDPWADVVAVLAVNSSSSWAAKQQAVAQLRQGGDSDDAGLLIKAGAVDPLFSLVMEAVNVLRPRDELPVWALDALVALAGLAQWASAQGMTTVVKPLRKRSKELAVLMYAVWGSQQQKNLMASAELLKWLFFDEPKGLAQDLLTYLGFPTLVNLGKVSVAEGVRSAAYNLVSVLKEMLSVGNAETANDFLAADGLQVFIELIKNPPSGYTRKDEPMRDVEWIQAVSNAMYAVGHMFATLQEGLGGKTMRGFLQSTLLCLGFLIATKVAFFADPEAGVFPSTYHLNCARNAVDVLYSLVRDNPSGALQVMNGLGQAQLDWDAYEPDTRDRYSESEIQRRMSCWYKAEGPKVLFAVLGGPDQYREVVHEWEPAVRVALKILWNLFTDKLRVWGFEGTEGQHRELVHDMLMRYETQFVKGDMYDFTRRHRLSMIVNWCAGGKHYQGGDENLNVRMSIHRVEIEYLAKMLLDTLAAYDTRNKTAGWIADLKAGKSVFDP